MAEARSEVGVGTTRFRSLKYRITSFALVRACLIELLAMKAFLNRLSWTTITIFAGFCTISHSLPNKAKEPARAPCTYETASIRREWGSLAPAERKAYTDAVNCLTTKPSVLDPKIYPAAYNHFLDFGATHVNLTLIIHLSGFFLPWHRHFVYLYEKALREECGYSGTQPYWDWPKWAENLYTSPLFDGSDYSLSGDGAPATTGPYTGQILHGSNLILPTGKGGGCVTSGPFVNMLSTMGPFTNLSYVLTGHIPPDSFTPKPRCLTRNINPYLATIYSNQALVDALLAAPDIGTFQSVLSTPPFSTSLGPHDAGHFTMGGIGSDVFGSPQDPAFFVHHANVDRMWTLWQAKDPMNRQNALNGTLTFLNIPPSPEIQLSDVAGFLALDEGREVGELMDTMTGLYCYRYE